MDLLDELSSQEINVDKENPITEEYKNIH